LGRLFLSFDRQVGAIMHGGMSGATLLCSPRMHPNEGKSTWDQRLSGRFAVVSGF